MTLDSNRFADALMEPFEAAALRQRRAAQRRLRGVPPLEPARPETLDEIWNSPTPGSLIDIAQGVASGFRGAGRALSGAYTVQPEIPGQWSEADEFRAQHARQQMRSDASALAGTIVLGSLPRVFARGAIDPNALGAGVPPRWPPRLPMDANSVAARADAMGFRRDMPAEFGRAPIGEKVATTAIDVNGRIFSGSNHTEAIAQAERALGIPFGEMKYGPIVEGFVTNAGRYVSRWEADEIAKRSGQGGARGKFGATRGLAAEDTRMSEVISSGRGQTAATAPGLPGGQGIWGWVRPESAPTRQPLSSGLRRPPTSDRHTVGPGIEATTEAAARSVPTWHRTERPAPMNVRGLADHEIQASLQNAWDQGFDAMLIKNYTTPARLKTFSSFVTPRNYVIQGQDSTRPRSTAAT